MKDALMEGVCKVDTDEEIDYHGSGIDFPQNSYRPIQTLTQLRMLTFTIPKPEDH